MMEKLGVLILTPFYEPNIGGVETHLKDLTDYLRRENRYKIYVLTYQPITTKARGPFFEKNGDSKIIRIPWMGFNLFHKLEPYPILEFLYITPWLFLWTFIFLLFKGRGIQVVHAQGFNAAFIARLLIKFFKKRFIVSTHAIYSMDADSLMARMVKWTLSTADRILTLSEASKRELLRVGVDSANIDTYTYWVNQEIFKPADKTVVKETVGWKGLFIVLFVGRFIEVKGTDILLKIAEETKEDIYFAFIGDGPLADSIKKKSDELKNVIFVGKIENNRLPLYYSAADIFCIPSQYEEGFGRVVLEALSCGTPVVGSNRGGIPEAINETVGVLVEPTAVSFKKVIESLYNNREKLKELSLNSRRYAENNFSEKNAIKITQNFKNLTSI